MRQELMAEQLSCSAQHIRLKTSQFGQMNDLDPDLHIHVAIAELPMSVHPIFEGQMK
jgi:hypothetical protein